MQRGRAVEEAALGLGPLYPMSWAAAVRVKRSKKKLGCNIKGLQTREVLKPALICFSAAIGGNLRVAQEPHGRVGTV